MISQASLAESDYEGWVAWLDGRPVYADGAGGPFIGYDACVPLFEEVPSAAPYRSTVAGVQDRKARPGGRQTMVWDELPHARVMCLELYAFRDVYNWGGPHGNGQPMIQLTRTPGHEVRWIQYKAGGLTLPAQGAEPGVRRTGIFSWTVGFWDVTAQEVATWELKKTGGEPVKTLLPTGCHPCWPKPLGFGLAPHVLGLTPEDVPPHPWAA